MEASENNQSGRGGFVPDQADMAVPRQEIEGAGDEVTLEDLCVQFVNDLGRFLGVGSLVTARAVGRSMSEILSLFLMPMDAMDERIAVKQEWAVTYRISQLTEDGMHESPDHCQTVAASSPEQATAMIRAQVRETLSRKVTIVDCREIAAPEELK